MAARLVNPAIPVLRVAAAALLLALGTASAHAQQGGSGPMSGMKLSGDQPIQIESDRLEVRDQENKAIFTGNVTVVQGETLMKAGRMTVFYAGGQGIASTGQSDIDRIEVDGTVYLKSATQVATADRGQFNMKTEIFVLTGKKVVLTEGENVLVGCKLTADMSTGRAEVEGCPGDGGGSGRVKMLLKPGSQTTQ